MENHFIRIQAALEAADYKASLKAAEAGNAEDVLRLATARGGQPTQLEVAYALWKLGKFQEALKQLEGATDIGAQHLRALLCLRTEQPAKASELYHALLPSVQGDALATAELATNLVAAQLLGGDLNALATLKSAGVSAKTAHELAFNVACAALAGGRLEEAEEHLDLALRRGQETLLQEGAAEQDIDKELAVVQGQAAYLLLLRGDFPSAIEGFQAVLSRNLGADPSTAAVCTSNLLAAKAASGAMATSLKDPVKRLASHVKVVEGECVLSEALAARLPPQQRGALLHNFVLGCLLALLDKRPAAMSTKDCISAAEKLAACSPNSGEAMMLAAAARGLLGSNRAGSEVIERWLEAHPDAEALAPVLLAAQIESAAQSPQFQRIAELLGHACLPMEYKYTGAIAATRWAMLKRAFAPVDALIADAEACAVWWQGQVLGEERSDALCACWTHIATILVQADRKADALGYFLRAQEVANATSKPSANVARIVRAIAALDPTCAAGLLPHVSNLPGIAEVQQAEERDLLYARSKGTSVLFGLPVRGGSHGAAEDKAIAPDGRVKTKRKRKPRYPKGFDPECPGPPPDAERWLPKHERTEFRKRRKRGLRNQPISKGAQGMGQVDQSLDKSSMVVEEQEVAAPSAAPRLPGRPGPKGGKRKGKR